MNTEVRIEDVLRSEGVFVCTTSGVSMYPMLRDRRDVVVIKPLSGSLKKYDVPLYRRGEKYVLHRVIKVHGNGSYNIRGDNCVLTEKNITEENIIGVLDGFWRGDKKIELDSFGYKLYSRIWVLMFPIIRFLKYLRGIAAGVLRKLRKGGKEGKE